MQPVTVTAFRKELFRSKPPTSATFNPASLKSGAQAIDEADQRLLMAALLIHTHTVAMKDVMPIDWLDTLGAADATILAVASLNQQFALLVDRQSAASRRAARREVVSMDQLSQRPIAGRQGAGISADSITDASTDAVESWLFDAAKMGARRPYPRANLMKAATVALQRYGYQRALHDLWQQCLWQDWRFYALGEDFAFKSADPSFHKLRDAWDMRQQAVFMQAPWIEISTWPTLAPARRREIQLPRSVVGIKKGRGPRFEVGRPSSKPDVVPPIVITRAGLEASYLASFLGRPLPLSPSLTCDILMSALHVINDAATALEKDRPRPAFANSTNARLWALTLRREDLVVALASALQIDAVLSDVIVSFFTWHPNLYKGLWGAPIVAIPGTTDVCLVRNVLAAANRLRQTEIWMQRGGLDDTLPQGSRGDAYEAELRAAIAQKIDDNEMLHEARCAPFGLKKDAAFPEQVDLLVRLGRILIVGEVKCLLFPSDPRERFNYLETLVEASRQARRKAVAVAAHPGPAAAALQLAEDVVTSLTIIPLVVVNQGFGASLSIEGCRVIDAAFLKLFLGSSTYIKAGAFATNGAGMAFDEGTLYRDEADAAARFETMMAAPPPLQHFLNRLSADTFDMPAVLGARIVIDTFRLGDVSAQRRGLGAALATSIGGGSPAG